MRASSLSRRNGICSSCDNGCVAGNGKTDSCRHWRRLDNDEPARTSNHRPQWAAGKSHRRQQWWLCNYQAASKELFRKRTIGTDQSNGVGVPRFSSVAAAFGIAYTKLENLDTLEQDLGGLLQRPEAILIEIDGLAEQVYLEVSFAKTQERRFVRRPLEDQFPFMERSVLKNEMIVPVIDQ